MPDLQQAQKAIREENLSGWLFNNVFHRDEISDLVLGVSPDHLNTRPWVCIVFPDRPPVKIVHTIEPGILDQVPGPRVVYASRTEFLQALEKAVPRGSRVAAQFSSRFPVSSFMDHGTALILASVGVDLVSSEELIVRFLGTLGEEGFASHERAASALYEIVRSVWERIVAAIRSGMAIYETDVQRWVIDFIQESGLEADNPPLVASGRGSANPHYSSAGRGEMLKPGDVVQLDLWARERAPDSVYADISWVGVLAEEPAPRFQRVFDAVVEARETAVRLISGALEQGRTVTGADVDRAVRKTLVDLGLGHGMRHRTGHSIGSRVHGFGVNLDSIEFPDERVLREGACFSIEPGLYLEELGMRTEIDCYIRNGRLVVSGNERQTRLLFLG